MFELPKTHNRKLPIKIWRKDIDDIENSCLMQAINLSDHPAVFKHVALMPDTHMGYGMPIGGVLALEGAVCPNAVGVDIGCGMSFIRTNIKVEKIDKETLKKIIGQIKRDIPMGFSHNDKKTTEANMDIAEELASKYSIFNCTITKIAGSLGSLGGGNHFIELQEDEDGFLCVMLHSGSRNVGYEIGKRYNDIAKDLNEMWHSNVDPKHDLAFLPVNTEQGQEYINEMNFALEFAELNRQLMMEKVCQAMSRYLLSTGVFVLGIVEEINIHHNYAALENHFGKNVWVHRKGATSAKKDQLGIIPGSMGTASYIVRGKGNRESFMSCSHGAGRLMGRNEAKKKFTLEQFKEAMGDVVSNDINNAHLDESPLAYKNIDEVIELQKDLVDVVHTLKPIANIKG